MIEALRTLLTSYLAGTASRNDVRLWLAEFDWDDTSQQALTLRDTVAEIDLILEEVTERLRPERELQDSIQAILCRMDSLTTTRTGR